ncbi:SitI3 family protein [Amycolatopsis sp. NPDC051758]|uniref:SitI3 family protein n=1 Tax=Amycolatopsis sp. NPDC051758 TaxID=3363935 RepID=UPI0037B6C0DD
MAISYSLELAARSSSETVASEIRDVATGLGLFDPAVTAEKVLEQGAATKNGTWIRVVGTKPRPWNPVSADLGFTPTVSIAFQLDKERDISEQQDDVIRLVSGLLARVGGDAVLHHQFEEIWLLRRDGVLTVSEQQDIWPPQRLAALSQPFHRQTHSFAEV